MKNILMIMGIAFFTSGCTPKINSIISPINKINQKCFNLPSKNYLSQESINEQNLYLLTYNALNKYGVKAIYGNTGSCKNYLSTSWSVVTGSQTVTTGGQATTRTYGNTYSNSSYKSPYSYSSAFQTDIPTSQTYVGTSQTDVEPTQTYQESTFYGTYKLEVGAIKNKSLKKAWEASQSSPLSASTVQEAERVTIGEQGIVDVMVKKMLIENLLIEDK